MVPWIISLCSFNVHVMRCFCIDIFVFCASLLKIKNYWHSHKKILLYLSNRNIFVRFSVGQILISMNIRTVRPSTCSKMFYLALRPFDFDTPDLKALENVFGTPELGEDLYFAFRSMHQQSGEKLSEFLQRLERSLRRVSHRGNISSTRGPS